MFYTGHLNSRHLSSFIHVVTIMTICSVPFTHTVDKNNGAL